MAGAIQDLDRGLVIGKKSFGKGLVQTAYEIDKKRTIKITTARYYIPSGRFIQKRDYVDEKFLLNKAVEDSLFKTKKVFDNWLFDVIVNQKQTQQYVVVTKLH